MGNFFTCEYQILKQGLDIGFHLIRTGAFDLVGSDSGGGFFVLRELSYKR